MEHFDVQCTSCKNQLWEEGSLLQSAFGPFVLCEVCRALYYIDVITNHENKSVIVVEPTLLNPEEEFDIIRNSEERIPLKEYLSQQKNLKQGDEDPWGDYLPSNKEEKNINPHFDKDLKTIIEESVTPSDIIRGLKE